MKQPTKVVIDTNILIAAVTNPESAAGKIMGEVFKGKINAYASEFICNEYAYIQESFNFALKKEGGYENYISKIRKTFNIVEPRQKISRIKADPTDNKFLECAVEADAEYLITSDKHFNFRTFRGIHITNSRMFYETVILNKS